MTAYALGYRLTLYAAKSVDPAEATVLTPAAGAPHTDPFQVATLAGVAGFQPYLDSLTGRRGSIDLFGRTTSIGTYRATLVDKQVGGNLARWWTAYFGDAKGRPRGQLKFVAEETLDGGATWAPYALGRVTAAGLKDKATATLTLREDAESLKMPIFVGEPHSSIAYAGVPAVMPLGVMNSAYGVLPKVSPLTGTVSVLTVNGATFMDGSARLITLDPGSVARINNIVTEQLVNAIAPNSAVWAGGNTTIASVVPTFSGTCRARLKHLSGANSGLTGDYRVGSLSTQTFTWSGGGTRVCLSTFSVAALDTGDRNALALPAAGVSVELTLWVEAPVSADNPILINDVDPATFLADLCAGKFGYLYRSPETLPPGKAYGDVKRAVATNGLAAFVGTQPPFRGIITKGENLLDWVERSLLKPYHWALYIDKQGRLNLVDLRLPNTLAGVPTLLDADVAPGEALAWDHDPTKAIVKARLVRYADQQISYAIQTLVPGTLAYQAGMRRYINIPVGVQSIDSPILVLDLGAVEFGDATYEVDGVGYHSFDGEQLQGQSRYTYLENKLLEVAQHLRRPLMWGLISLTLPCRRTATVTALLPGSLVLVDVDAVPDPATYLRGGVRLCRVVEVDEEGLLVKLKLVDLATNVVAAVPSLAQPALETNNTYGGVTVAVTLNASAQPAEIRYAITGTGVGSAPADTSGLWSGTTWAWGSTARTIVIRSSQTVTLRNLPPNSRVWVQGRTVPDSNVEPQLPSPWALAAGTGRADTAALPAPSAPAVSGSPTSRSGIITWTNGAADLAVEITLAQPTTDPRVRIATLLPGTTRYQLTNLDPSLTYRVGVRHALGQFQSAEVTVDLTTAASGGVLPVPHGVTVFRGGAI